MKTTLHIGELYGGGLVLGYRCSSRCRHCLYGCGPHRRDGLGSPEDLHRVLDELAARAPHARYHIGGGEPFLEPALLEAAVVGLAERGLALDYVETNGSWARDERSARETLRHLARLGLRCILVSVSPFHAEFIPVARTRTAIRAAEAELPNGAFVWLPDFFPDLSEAGEGRLDLAARLARLGPEYGRGLVQRYGLVTGARAGRFLATQGELHPAGRFRDAALCRGRLADTSHFHVDLEGNYVPGLCAGLRLPVEEVPGAVDLARYPLLGLLLDGGPAALVDHARPLGFAPLQGYASACDLCTHVRAFLAAHAPSPELGPAAFYSSESLDLPA
jgi:hypothetical protein